MKQERKTEIAFPIIYITREEFLILKNNSIEDDVKRKVQEILSSGSKTGVEQSHAVNTFKKSRLISMPKKENSADEIRFSKERSSLKNISKLQVYISIPEKEEEFKNIFGPLDNNQLKKIKIIKQTIANEKNPNIHFLTNSDLLTNEILNSPDNMPIILIGHNEGGEFRLPDGSGKKFESMDSLANVAKRTIIYLSCNSNIFTDNPATNFYLTYDDGIAITNRINSAYLETRDMTQLKKIITNILYTYQKDKNQILKYKIITSSIVISGISYTVYKIRQGNKKKKP